ncbi:MAG: hypothetical protein ABSG02_10570, partial [Terriglobales bacterium]
MSWKLSRTVLRGGTNSNVGPLLGSETWNDWGLYQFVIKGNKLYQSTGISGQYGIGAFDTDGTYLYDVDGQVFKA